MLAGVNKKPLVVLLSLILVAGIVCLFLPCPPSSHSVHFGSDVVLEAVEDGETEFPALDVRFRWTPGDLPTRSLLLSNVEDVAFLQRYPSHDIQLFADGGILRNMETTADFTMVRESSLTRLCDSYDTRFLPTTLLRMPDGSVHPQYHLLLRLDVTRQRLFHEEERLIALTELVIDPIDGTVDVVTPDVPEDIAEQDYPVRRICRARNAPPLPTRFCGTETEQSLQRYLFLVASMHNAETARRALPAVISRGQRLVDGACDTEKPFPDCWGEAADTAWENHRRILPYLLRLRELDCFELPELAEFINSPLFGKLFGEAWE